MKKKIILSSIALSIIILWFGLFKYQLDVSDYRGDGSIRPTGSGVFSRGYLIDVPVDISKTPSIIKTNKLPNINKIVSFSIAIPELKNSNINIFITIFNSSGQQIRKIILNTEKSLVGYNEKYNKTYLSTDCIIDNSVGALEFSSDSDILYRSHIIVKAGGYK